MQIVQLILLFIIFTNVIAHMSQGIAEENIQLVHQMLKKENDVHKMKMQDSDQLTKTGQIDQKKEIHQDDQGVNTQKINQEKTHNPDQGIKTHNVDHGMNAQQDGLKIEIPHIDQETKTQEENEIVKTTKEDDHMTKIQHSQNMKALQVDTQQLANEIAKGLISIHQCRDEQKKIIRKRENQQKQEEYFLETAGVLELVKEAEVWHKPEVKVANSGDTSPKKATMAKNKDALPVCAVTLTHRIELKIKKPEDELLQNLAELLEKHQYFLKITDEESRKILDKQEIEVDGEQEKSVKEELEKLGNAIANGLIWTKECKETAKKIIIENEKKLEMHVDNLIKYFHEAKKGLHEVKLENNAESTVKICPIYGLVYGKDNLKYWLENMPKEPAEPLEKSWTFIRHGVHGKAVLLEPIIKMLEKIKEKKIDLLIIEDATIKKDYKSMLKEEEPVKEKKKMV